MIEINVLVLLASSIIPFLVAFVWFNPRWNKILLHSNAKMNLQDNFDIKSFAVFILIGLFTAVTMHYQVIHQFHLKSMLIGEVGFEDQKGSAYDSYKYIMNLYGHNFRSLKHGAFHGFLNSIFIVLPILCVTKFFADFNWKFVFVQWIYWAITFVLMGSLICYFT